MMAIIVAVFIYVRDVCKGPGGIGGILSVVCGHLKELPWHHGRDWAGVHLMPGNVLVGTDLHMVSRQLTFAV